MILVAICDDDDDDDDDDCRIVMSVLGGKRAFRFLSPRLVSE